MNIIVEVVNYMILIICVLIGVAFVTLFERKVLGCIQLRKGPNKVGYLGLMQPFSDAMKLFCKEQIILMMPNFFIFYLCPILSLFFSLVLWCVVPYSVGLINFNFSILFVLCCLSIGVYPVMVGGWSSNCKYSMLGSLRSVAQTISYEVSLALILLSYMILIESVSLESFGVYQCFMWFFFISLPMSLVWFGCSLAEVNRTPFDFVEGESELVSGFNTEYGSGGFALIFMAEYTSILFMSVLYVVLFLGSGFSILFYLKFICVVFIFVWVRGTFPRLRYDMLMNLAWKSFLPVSINYLILFLGLKIFFFSLVYN